MPAWWRPARAWGHLELQWCVVVVLTTVTCWFLHAALGLAVIIACGPFGRQGARGLSTCLVAVALQAPAAAAAAVGVTTQAAVQVAQAAQAVSQQAASLHAAAEVHAAKAHAATSQVQSLHATAQVRPRHTLLTWQVAEGVLWTGTCSVSREFMSAFAATHNRAPCPFPPCLFPCCPLPCPAPKQVIAQTHEELVKKIEDVKQEAVAKIQAPAVSD